MNTASENRLEMRERDHANNMKEKKEIKK